MFKIKKFLSIIVLGLLISSNANAKILNPYNLDMKDFWKKMNKAGSVAVSPDAHTLPCGPLPAVFDHTALLEFAMAGYVSGSNTLIPDIAQLEAGEIRQWTQSRSEDKTLTI